MVKFSEYYILRHLLKVIIWNTYCFRKPKYIFIAKPIQKLIMIKVLICKCGQRVFLISVGFMIYSLNACKHCESLTGDQSEMLQLMLCGTINFTWYIFHRHLPENTDDFFSFWYTYIFYIHNSSQISMFYAVQPQRIS